MVASSQLSQLLCHFFTIRSTKLDKGVKQANIEICMSERVIKTEKDQRNIIKSSDNIFNENLSTTNYKLPETRVSLQKNKIK